MGEGGRELEEYQERTPWAGEGGEGGGGEWAAGWLGSVLELTGAGEGRGGW